MFSAGTMQNGYKPLHAITDKKAEGFKLPIENWGLATVLPGSRYLYRIHR